MNLWLKVGAIAMPLLVAIEADLMTFRDAKKQDPATRFDWPLALVKWSKGALASAGVGAAVVGE